MIDIVELIFYVCAIFLVIACLRAANLVSKGSDFTIKCCIGIILMAAGAQVLAGLMKVMPPSAMLVTALLSIGIGSLLMFERRERRVGWRSRNFEGD
jgi:hypothetical protein